MIKYLGSKRRLVPALAVLAGASGARTALDLFCGTTRVSQAFKSRGIHTTAVDSARCAHVLARCYVATDPDADAGFRSALVDAVDGLNEVPGRPGYVTETFCVEARYFRPDNGARIDAVRDAIEDRYADTPLWPVLLTSLLEAADRVDSTTGLQMAYLKQWAPRAERPLTLRVPDLLDGPGRAVRGDACALVGTPELGDVTRSAFNGRRTMPVALADVVSRLAAEVVVLSYNNESWLTFDELNDLCSARGHVEVLAFDSARYVGARIGIHDPSGRKVGRVGHVRNTEYVVLAGPPARVRAMASAVESAGLGARVDRPVPVPAA
jgi:adenine-specific DNA-methyltransferase